ncbi:MAG: TIGR00730 family Rossman fold protein [Candidatus Sumerlaeia bacterium]|nr:TIGR00730 family Rossman fold protein [Candidatus Sumerlaeia bacterium]
MRSVCVFCASSRHASPAMVECARELGNALGTRGFELVFGGTEVGLMKVLADAAHEAGGRVVGVLPRFMQEKGIAYKRADELLVTDSMHDRKALMEARADAFVALPGGIGTLEELAEVLSLRVLGLHAKPIILLDADGYYAPLLTWIEQMIAAGLAKPIALESLLIAPSVEAAFELLDTWRAPSVPSKWS